MPTLNERISEFVKDKREKKGITQEQLAIKLFGSSTRSRINYISSVETGSRNLSIPTLEKYLKALDSDINFIEY
jgi:transcriptional regulator with XRE-family HTH domain